MTKVNNSKKQGKSNDKLNPQPKGNQQQQTIDLSDPLDQSYNQIQENTEKLLLQSPVFNSIVFRKWHQRYLNENNPDALKGMRIYVMKDTMLSLQRGFYYNSKKEKISIRNQEKEIYEEQLSKNKLYQFNEIEKVVYNSPTINQQFATTVEVIKEDCVETIFKLHKNGMKPVVLNMASKKRAGGGFETGQKSQEEALFRSTNYIYSLLDPNDIFKKFNPNCKKAPQDQLVSFVGPDQFYPLSDYDIIYSPNVQLLRHGEGSAFEYLETPLEISIIAASAFIRPNTFIDKKTNQLMMTSKFEEGTRQKIRGILYAALDNGHESIVLSAFGCGAYKNPENHMAQLFYEVITQEFPNSFKSIIFAILEDGKDQSNYLAFKKVFDKCKVIQVAASSSTSSE